MNIILKSLIKKASHFAHLTTSILDLIYMNTEVSCRRPPIFIIGVPRTGTTLLYQLMVLAFQLSYVPNVANTFYMCPVFASRLGLRLFAKYRTQYESRWGYERGLMAPSEAGNIWNRWFPHEKREGFNYTPAGYLDSDTRRNIYRIAANHEHLFDAPFVNKNVKWSVRLAAVKEIFPDARLIQVKRNPIDTALSILRIRRQQGLKWFSVMPKEMEKVKEFSDVEQVAHQICYTEKAIHEDSQLFRSDNRLTVQYESLCDNTRRELDRIRSNLGDLPIEFKSDDSNIPKAFHSKRVEIGDWIQPRDVNAIEDIFKEIS